MKVQDSAEAGERVGGTLAKGPSPGVGGGHVLGDGLAGLETVDHLAVEPAEFALLGRQQCLDVAAAVARQIVAANETVRWQFAEIAPDPRQDAGADGAERAQPLRRLAPVTDHARRALSQSMPSVGSSPLDLNP